MVTNIGHLLSTFTGTSERCKFLSGSYSVRLSTELSNNLAESFRGFPQSLNNNHTVSRALTYLSFMFTVVSNSLLSSSRNLNAIAKKAHIKHHSRAKPKNVLLICVTVSCDFMNYLLQIHARKVKWKFLPVGN